MYSVYGQLKFRSDYRIRPLPVRLDSCHWYFVPYHAESSASVSERQQQKEREATLCYLSKKMPVPLKLTDLPFGTLTRIVASIPEAKHYSENDEPVHIVCSTGDWKRLNAVRASCRTLRDATLYEMPVVLQLLVLIVQKYYLRVSKILCSNQLSIVYVKSSILTPLHSVSMNYITSTTRCAKKLGIK